MISDSINRCVFLRREHATTSSGLRFGGHSVVVQGRWPVFDSMAQLRTHSPDERCRVVVAGRGPVVRSATPGDGLAPRLQPERVAARCDGQQKTRGPHHDVDEVIHGGDHRGLLEVISAERPGAEHAETTRRPHLGAAS